MSATFLKLGASDVCEEKLPEESLRESCEVTDALRALPSVRDSKSSIWSSRCLRNRHPNVSFMLDTKSLVVHAGRAQVVTV